MVAVAVIMDENNCEVYAIKGYRLEKESTFHNFRKDLAQNIRRHGGSFAYVSLAEIVGNEVDDDGIDNYGEATVCSKEERDGFEVVELPWVKNISRESDYRKTFKKELLNRHKIKYYVKEDSYLEQLLDKERELMTLKREYLNNKNK